MAREKCPDRRRRGVAISTLRSLLNNARRLGIIKQSPANGSGSSRRTG
jgi:hypothetical protein